MCKYFFYIYIYFFKTLKSRYTKMLQYFLCLSYLHQVFIETEHLFTKILWKLCQHFNFLWVHIFMLINTGMQKVDT